MTADDGGEWVARGGVPAVFRWGVLAR